MMPALRQMINLKKSLLSIKLCWVKDETNVIILQFQYLFCINFTLQNLLIYPQSEFWCWNLSDHRMNVSHWFTLFRVANVGLKCLLRDLQWPESLTSPAITAPQRQPKIHFEEAYGIIWVLSENYCFQNGHSWSISNCVSFIGFKVQILPLDSKFRSLKVGLDIHV